MNPRETIKKDRNNSLFWKISATFLVLLVLLGVMYVLITGYIANDYFQEVNQRLYGQIADSTVQLVRPLVDGEVDTLAVQEIMHSMMVINPSVEVYLLDVEGRIITYVAPYKRVKLDKVALRPIREFIDSGERKPFIKGDDPRHPGQKKVFSAAPIEEEGQLAGYMYIILASEEQHSVVSMLSGSYMLRLGRDWFFVTLVGALAAGLLALWYLTSNLRRIIEKVRRFKEGDLQARIEAREMGDFPLLSNTFNDMADKIVGNIQQLQAVENLRRELIANVSHDLRTPLAILQGYVETLLIKDETISTDNRRRYLNLALDSSEKLAHLIEQLFEYSKLEAKQIEPNKEPFFISELAQDIYQKYQVLGRSKGIHLRLQLAPNLPLVFADLALVERVLQNLMDNALKFTPEGGTVTIELQEAGHHVEVRVADTGPGIPESEQSYIFERYHKGGPTDKKSKGAGLGLAIAKKILELHNSTIQVHSKLNEGTSFEFNLPAYSG